MKKISIIIIILGALLIINGIVVLPQISLHLMSPNTSSIGIIGGVDGPTAIFVTSSLWINSIFGKLTICGAVILIVGIVLLIINKFKKK